MEIPLNRTKTNFQKQQKKFNDYVTTHNYPKILNTFKDYFIKMTEKGEKDKKISMIEQNSNDIYNYYRQIAKQDLDYDSNNIEKIAKLFIAIFNDNRFYLFQKKTDQVKNDNPKSPTPSDKTSRSDTSTKSPKRREFTYDESENVISLFKKFKHPVKYIQYNNGIPQIVNSSEILDPNRYKLCQYHSHNYSFININKLTETYGYITDIGNVYDLCYTLIKKSNIPLSFMNAILKLDSSFKGLFSTIDELIKNLSESLNKYGRTQTLIQEKNIIMLEETKNLSAMIKNQATYDELKNQFEDLFEISPIDSYTVERILNVKKAPSILEIFEGTKFLNDTKEFLVSFYDFFGILRQNIDKEFSKNIFRTLYGSTIDANNFISVYENVKKNILQEYENAILLQKDAEKIRVLSFDIFFYKPAENNYLEKVLNYVKKEKFDFLINIFSEDDLFEDIDEILNDDTILDDSMSSSSKNKLIQFLKKVKNQKQEDQEELTIYNQNIREFEEILNLNHIDRSIIKNIINVREENDENKFESLIDTFIEDFFTPITRKYELTIFEKHTLISYEPQQSETFFDWIDGFQSFLETTKIYDERIKYTIEEYLKNANTKIFEDDKNVSEKIRQLNQKRTSIQDIIKKNIYAKLLDAQTQNIQNKILLKNQEKDIASQEKTITNTFTDILPLTKLLIRFFENNSQIPKNLSLMIDYWNNNQSKIVSSIVKLGKLKIDLLFYDKTEDFYNIRSNVFSSLSSKIKNYTLNDFETDNTQLVTNIKRNVRFLNSMTEKDFVSNTILGVSRETGKKFSSFETFFDLISEAEKIKNYEILKNVLMGQGEFFIARDLKVIISYVQQKMITKNLPDLNDGLIKHSNYFILNHKITQETYDNINNYQKIMVRLINLTDKSISVINQGPGLHFLYDCCYFLFGSLYRYYLKNEFDEIIIDTITDKKYESFLNVLPEKNIQTLFNNEKFDDLLSLLSGKLDSSSFIRIIDEVSNIYPNPIFHTSDNLSPRFIICILQILQIIYDRKVISCSAILKKFNEFIPDLFPVSIIDKIITVENKTDHNSDEEFNLDEEFNFEEEEEILSTEDEQIIKSCMSRILNGIKDLMINVKTFTDEFTDKNGRIVSYNNYIRYKDSYEFYNHKNYQLKILSYFNNIFDDLIEKDLIRFHEEAMNKGINFYNVFSISLSQNQDIEKFILSENSINYGSDITIPVPESLNYNFLNQLYQNLYVEDFDAAFKNYNNIVKSDNRNNAIWLESLTYENKSLQNLIYEKNPNAFRIFKT